MSLAKVISVNAARKDPGSCENCHIEICKGDAYRWFTVGFRSGVKHVRCVKPECFPLPSQRESSMTADAYAAQEYALVNLPAASSLEEIQQILEDCAEGVRGVAEEYENSEMFERSEDLQERADILNAASEGIESWEPTEEEPDLEGRIGWHSVNDNDSIVKRLKEEHSEWLEQTIEEAMALLSEMELP